MTKNSMTEGRLLSPLLRFSIPVLLALLLQAMYGAVDLLIVGQFASAAEVSAVATGSQTMHTMMVVVTGLATGMTVLIGQKIGEGNPEEAGRVIGSSICLFALLGLILTAAMVAFTAPLCRLLQAPEEAFSQTVDYVRICSAGLLFIVAYNVLGSMFRGIGDSRLPLISVAIASVVNILGDLLLVAVFRMGAAGAALATIAAQAVSVLLSLLVIRRRTLPFRLSRQHLRFDGRRIGRVLKLGVPVALQDLLVSVSFMVLLAIVNSLGLIASAGVGVAEKLCGFIMLVPSAFMQSVSVFVAQNIGAGQPGRAKRAMGVAILCSTAIGVVMAWLAFFHGDLLAGIFSRDSAVIAAAAEYLKAYAIDCLLVGVMFCMVGYFNGCGKTFFVMVEGIIGAFGVRIPVSFIASRAAEVSLLHVGLATPASTSVQIVLCVGYYLWLRRRDALSAKP